MPTKTVKTKTAKTKTVTKVVAPVKEQHAITDGVVPEKKNVLIPILVGAVIVAAFAVGYLYGRLSVYESGKAGTTPTKQQQAQTATPEPASAVTLDMIKGLFADSSNISFGDASKKILFVEFSDPSCPYCHIAAGKNADLLTGRFATKAQGGSYVPPIPEMKKLVDQGKAGYVWLYSFGHGNGELATQALYCAKEQNKFWEAHDLLMSSAGYTLMNETIKSDLTKIDPLVSFLSKGVDGAQLKTCLQSKKYAGRVAADQQKGEAFGINGTPGFFINAKAFAGAYSFTDMQSAVDAALK